MNTARTIEKLLRQQAALAGFGSFAFGEHDLQKILSEAARICAESLEVPYTKICRYRPAENDLHVVAGFGWQSDMVGHVISQADESSTQGRAFVTGKPVVLKDIRSNNSYNLPDFYAQHGIISTVDVLIKGKNGPFGVLEADCSTQHTFDEHDINFLTGFANVVAEAVGTAERTATLKSTLVMMQNLIVEKEELIDEKMLLATELQHRVRNNLQLVYGMLLRQIQSGDSNSKDGMRTIARRVMTLAKVYDHLLGHDLVQKIDFGAYLGSLCASLEEFQEKGEITITMTCAVVPLVLGLDIVTSLGVIVAEIISNAYLHAFPVEAGTIQVSLKQEGKRGVLTIKDDGIGFVEKKASKRHGVSLINRLMKQAKGEAQLKSDNGTLWTLIFPLEENENQGGQLALESEKPKDILID